MKQVLDNLRLNGLIPVLKLKHASDAVSVCKALRDGGLHVAEITFRTDAAEESIRNVRKAIPDMLVGAGTVTCIGQAERAVAAGAEFVVSPGFNPQLVKWCIERGIAVVPGVNNPSGMEAAMELGLQCVKFFPAEATGGVKFIKAVRGPYPELCFIPTGGINEENMLNYLATPGVIACGGSWMVPSDAIERGDYDAIRGLVSKTVQKMLSFRLAHVGINAGGPQAALEAAERFARLFGFEARQGNSSIMSGSAVELMKAPGRGVCGHIAISTADIDRAMYGLEKAGVTFDGSSAKLDAKGKLKAIYLTEEIAGFAIHLLQA